MSHDEKNHINQTIKSDVQAAIDAAKLQVQLIESIDGHKRVVALPNSVALTDLPERKLERPRFLTAAPTFHDVKTFVVYINDFKDTDTRIFFTQSGSFVAVLDYHCRSALGLLPRHGDHIAKLELIRSPEWNAWAGQSDKGLGQQAFAEFIEDNARDILDPDPAVMLRVASGLHATIGATFRQATNQAHGQINLSYEEQINGTVNGKEEAIPSTFRLGLRPFMGCSRYPVDCRLRYRIDRSVGASLRLHYKALHLAEITEAAVDAVVQRVRDETSIEPALGAHNGEAVQRGV